MAGFDSKTPKSPLMAPLPHRSKWNPAQIFRLVTLFSLFMCRRFHFTIHVKNIQEKQKFCHHWRSIQFTASSDIWYLDIATKLMFPKAKGASQPWPEVQSWFAVEAVLERFLSSKMAEVESRRGKGWSRRQT